MSVPVAAQSKAWICGRSPIEIVGSNPIGGKDVCYECCVLSGRGLCVGFIPRPESPTECGVSECDLGTSGKRRPWPTGGSCTK